MTALLLSTLLLAQDPQVGTLAPAVKLTSLETNKTFNMADNALKRTTVLVFGSCT